MKLPRQGCFLTEEHFNRLDLVLEQIDGLVELLFERLQSEIEQDGPAMTAYNVIKEKVEQAARIADDGFKAYAESLSEKRVK